MTMRRVKRCCALLVLLLALVAAATSATTTATRRRNLLFGAKKQLDSTLFKNRQGPPSEFGQHILPNPSEAAQSSDSALIPIRFQPSTDGKTMVWSGRLPVDSETMISLTLLSPLAKQLSVKFLDQRPDESLTIEQVLESVGFTPESGVPSLSYHVQNLKPGMRLVEISCPVDAPELSLFNTQQPHVQLLLFNDSPVRSHTQLINYDLQVGETIGFTAFLFEGRSQKEKEGLRSKAVKPTPLRVQDSRDPMRSSIVADMDIVMPNGEEIVISMHDNGMTNDGQANDGVFGATLKATQPGVYVVQVVMRAQMDIAGSEEPLSILRTSQHVITVVEDAMTLVPSGDVVVAHNDEMIDIVLHAKPYTDETFGQQYAAYAEVYGTANDESNHLLTKKQDSFVPVAWINGMTIAEKDEETGLVKLKLRMSAKWLAQSKAMLPLKLKNVHVFDIDTFVPLSILPETDTLVHAPFAKKMLLTHPLITEFDGQVTQNMKTGPRPTKLILSTRKAASNGHKLLLIHGYCAAQNPFPEEDFTNFESFLDSRKSRSNDQFARMIQEFAEDFSSISIVAHSQGGLAALHLLNYYWSHLDNAEQVIKNKASINGTSGDAKFRLIQSVGSPYRGTALAGSLAAIGKVFGVGCGSNTDLTHDGAERWLSTISMDARKKVFYHTSQYKPLSWCNLAANAVLAWPNDGVTEYDYSNLDGGNPVVHLEKWCHSADMKYPSQTLNHEQNKAMNGFAHL